ncbi:diguanylate cyclase [Eionea flava]
MSAFRRQISLLALYTAIFMAISYPTHAWALEKVALQLKWFHQFQFAGYYAALEKGYYKDAGLDVSIIERSPKITPLTVILSGQAEYGISDSSLILNRLNGNPIVVLGAIFQHSPLVLMTRKEDELISPYELKGKRVMRQYNIDDASLTAMFHALDIDESDIIHVPHTFKDNDLFLGKVDAMSAYSSDQPFLAKEKGIAVNIINPINYGIDFYGDMLFVSEAEMLAHPDRAIRFLNSSIKGWRYALENSEEIIQLILTKYSSKKSADHLRFEAQEIKKIIRPDLIEIGHLNKKRFERLADIYRAEKLTDINASLAGIDYRDHINPTNKLYNWLFWLAMVIMTALIALTVLVTINRRLTQVIVYRTGALQSSKKKLEHYISVVNQYVATSTMDTKGLVIDVSDAFCTITEYDRDELIGKPHLISGHSKNSEEKNKDIWQCLISGESWHGEIETQSKNGHPIWLEANIQPNANKQNEISNYTLILIDISDKKRIEQLSITDKLTGLYNRFKLDSALAFELYRVNRTQEKISIAMIDIDFFKDINDNYGHIIGDKILVHIANIIKQSSRSLDVVGRWGGEEFFIILPSTDLDGAYALASKICKNIEDSVFDDITVTASIGVASFHLGEQAEDFIKRADDALYSAKHKGRNRVESNQERKVHYLSDHT